jgi:hypothetical protein
MAELEVDAQDVVRLMLQFCKENGLKDSLKALQQESQVQQTNYPTRRYSLTLSAGCFEYCRERRGIPLRCTGGQLGCCSHGMPVFAATCAKADGTIRAGHTKSLYVWNTFLFLNCAL